MRGTLTVCLLLALACSEARSRKEPPKANGSTADADAAQTRGEVPSTFRAIELPEELEGPTPPSNEPPSLKVLEPGGDPSHQLRWAVKPGFEQTLSMKTRVGTQALLGGLLSAKAPDRTTIYRIKLKAEKVDPDGALSVAFTIEDLQAKYQEGTKALPRERLEEAVPRLRGLRGSYTLDPRGWVKHVEFGAPPDAPREAQDMANEVKWAIRQLMPTFPDRAGKGTRWTEHYGVLQDGVSVNGFSTMEITKLESTRVDVRANFKQAGEVEASAGPRAGGSMELRRFVAEGESEVWWDLTKLAPRTASVISKMQTAYRFQEENASPRMMLAATNRTVTIPGD